ncbi:hypothetical protein JVT61DRAFT_13147 [Boletus reticuloceps]|uniref:Uncharacterized protein n=1 Tax=Boletus reticuloceps TaxID=495285 RepID=A0A8I2YWB7_9AGAM|nr:hypothetical protein JVT61DRAFT_13147 [Boletus reticuloceps]
MFTCGYIIGMIPSTSFSFLSSLPFTSTSRLDNLMLQLVPPRIWFPLMQIVWGVLTFCSSVVQNVQQLYAIRFLQGISEASTFVGTHYILGAYVAFPLIRSLQLPCSTAGTNQES